MDLCCTVGISGQYRSLFSEKVPVTLKGFGIRRVLAILVFYFTRIMMML
jgi:hypothetical protein